MTQYRWLVALVEVPDALIEEWDEEGADKTEALQYTDVDGATNNLITWISDTRKAIVIKRSDETPILNYKAVDRAISALVKREDLPKRPDELDADIPF